MVTILQSEWFGKAAIFLTPLLAHSNRNCFSPSPTKEATVRTVEGGGKRNKEKVNVPSGLLMTSPHTGWVVGGGGWFQACQGSQILSLFSFTYSFFSLPSIWEIVIPDATPSSTK